MWLYFQETEPESLAATVCVRVSDAATLYVLNPIYTSCLLSFCLLPGFRPVYKQDPDTAVYEESKIYLEITCTPFSNVTELDCEQYI